MYVNAVLLSVRQPWADLLVDGTKTVETRRRLKPETFAPGTVVLVYATAPTKAVIGHFVSGGVLVGNDRWGGLLNQVLKGGYVCSMTGGDWVRMRPRFGLIATEARRWARARRLDRGEDTGSWIPRHRLRIDRPPRSYQFIEVPADLLAENGWRRL